MDTVVAVVVAVDRAVVASEVMVEEHPLVVVHWGMAVVAVEALAVCQALVEEHPLVVAALVVVDEVEVVVEVAAVVVADFLASEVVSFVAEGEYWASYINKLDNHIRLNIIYITFLPERGHLDLLLGVGFRVLDSRFRREALVVELHASSSPPGSLNDYDDEKDEKETKLDSSRISHRTIR